MTLSLNHKSVIFFNLCCFAIFLSIGTLTALHPLDALEINTHEECVELGGTWNECPPNNCQRSEEYTNSEVVCPEVCGEPSCEGLVPEDQNDLSDVHNTTLDHRELGQDEIPAEDVTLKLELINQTSNQPLASPSKETPTVETKSLINVYWQGFFLILGIILILSILIIRYKKRIFVKKR